MRKIKNNTRKIALAAIIASVIIGFAAFYFQKINNTQPSDNTGNEQKIDLSPATDEEKQQAEDNKKRLSDELTKNEDNSTELKQVKPVITSAGQYDNAQYGSAIEVRTLVTGVYENGGTCTATFTLNSQKFERKVEAIQDATTTRCDVVFIPRSEFPSAGIWDLVVNYTSPTAYGNSDVSKVEVK